MADTLILNILANLKDNASPGLGRLKTGIGALRTEGSRADAVVGNEKYLDAFQDKSRPTEAKGGTDG